MVDFAVVGGGVVGLAIGRELLRRHPDTSVAVLEKESSLAQHASGRNSGVIHAGFYYAPDSLKATLTRRGNVMLHEFCAEHDIAVNHCGKVVVTRSEDELPRMAELLRRGRANNVPLEQIDEQQLAELEPLARTVGAALWSPTTSSADPAAVVIAMAEDFTRSGGALLLGAEVIDARPGEVLMARDGHLERLECDHIINCAGLHADTVANWFGMCDDYTIVPFKGVYRYADWPTGRLQRHVYPVPDPANPFLGVHLTVTAAGRAKLGPTAIPVLGRERYGFTDPITSESASSVRGLARFLTSRHHQSWRLVAEEVPKYSRQQLAAKGRQLVPALRAADFKETVKPGIRAQLIDREGRLEMDFVVRGDEGSTHVLNAVSPAWTSSLAFAEHVVDTHLPG